MQRLPIVPQLNSVVYQVWKVLLCLGLFSWSNWKQKWAAWVTWHLTQICPDRFSLAMAEETKSVGNDDEFTGGSMNYNTTVPDPRQENVNSWWRLFVFSEFRLRKSGFLLEVNALLLSSYWKDFELNSALRVKIQMDQTGLSSRCSSGARFQASWLEVSSCRDPGIFKLILLPSPANQQEIMI